jgi:alpha-L-fucosidase 2
MVYQIKSSHPVSLSIRYDSKLKYSCEHKGSEIMIHGVAPSDIIVDVPNGFSSPNNQICYDEQEKSIHFEGRVALDTDGQVSDKDCLFVENATIVNLLFASCTSFADVNCKRSCENIMIKAMKKGEGAIYKNHCDDFSEIFNRVSLKLNTKSGYFSIDNKANRLSGHAIETVFQYGRYLMISSSREGTQAANLQGIWNQELVAPWWSNYTININTEMNYWPVWKTNMAECASPLLDLVSRLVKNGRQTARNYGCRGTVSHHQTDIWAMTTPVGYQTQRVDDSSSWGMWNMSLPWFCTELFRGYRYTQDKDFLYKVYDLMNECAAFLKDYTVRKHGKITTCPSTSPENIYFSDDNKRRALCITSAMDIGILKEFYTALRSAAEIMNDTSVVIEANEMLSSIPDYATHEGKILEWGKVLKEEDPGHRHVSMLYGLYPGSHLLNNLKSEAKNSLDYRVNNGGASTGWSVAWVIALYARLRDSQNTALMISKQLLKMLHVNLFGSHPPDVFQIDMNFGFTSAICETIIQEYDGMIYPMPVLLDLYPRGSVKGLVIQGGHVLDMQWENETVHIQIYAMKDDNLRISLIQLNSEDDESRDNTSIVKIGVRKGEKYSIDGFRVN